VVVLLKIMEVIVMVLGQRTNRSNEIRVERKNSHNIMKMWSVNYCI
jgi:hypothetical protein